MARADSLPINRSRGGREESAAAHVELPVGAAKCVMVVATGVTICPLPAVWFGGWVAHASDRWLDTAGLVGAFALPNVVPSTRAGLEGRSSGASVAVVTTGEASWLTTPEVLLLLPPLRLLLLLLTRRPLDCRLADEELAGFTCCASGSGAMAVIEMGDG